MRTSSSGARCRRKRERRCSRTRLTRPDGAGARGATATGGHSTADRAGDRRNRSRGGEYSLVPASAALSLLTVSCALATDACAWRGWRRSSPATRWRWCSSSSWSGSRARTSLPIRDCRYPRGSSHLGAVEPWCRSTPSCRGLLSLPTVEPLPVFGFSPPGAVVPVGAARSRRPVAVVAPVAPVGPLAAVVPVVPLGPDGRRRLRSRRGTRRAARAASGERLVRVRDCRGTGHGNQTRRPSRRPSRRPTRPILRRPRRIPTGPPRRRRGSPARTSASPEPAPVRPARWWGRSLRAAARP